MRYPQLRRAGQVEVPSIDPGHRVAREPAAIRGARGTVAAPLPEQRHSPSTDQSVRKVVLFADDDPTTRAIVRVALEQDGWVVEDAEDGLQACEAFVRCSPDIVLLDVLMPVLDGFGACVKLRSLPGGEHVPVLMVTGGDDFASVSQAYDVGATDFLTKPVNLMILRNRLQYMLRAKRDLDARRESEAKNQAVLDAIPDVMFQVTRDGEIVDFIPGKNSDQPARTDAFGRTVARVPGGMPPQLRSSVTRALSTGDPQLLEYSARDVHGRTRQYEARTVASGPDRVLSIIRDVTDFAQVEQELREAKEAAEAANRAKSRFLAAMSHELRTPLNSVIGFTNVLRKNKHEHLSDKEMEYLQRIQSNGTDLLALINDILDLSKVEAGEVDVVVEPVSVERLVADVLAKIEGTDHVQKLTLRTVIPGNTAPVMADSHRLQQVLLNLVANAVKFTEQGDVTVRVATDGLTPTRIEVEDQGIGIPKDQLESIFEPFQQADDTMWRRFGGTGLGLTICRSLCRAMGFALTVTSVQGRGSTFTIDLTGDGTNRLLSEPRGDTSAAALSA